MLACTARIAGRPRSFVHRFLPGKKSSSLETEGFYRWAEQTELLVRHGPLFAGSRKASTRRVTNNLPTRASNILCGVRQLCQVKLSQRQMCQVKLSHAVSQTGLVAKRDSLTWHICLIQRCRLPVVAGVFVLNRILQQPAQVVAEALAVLIGESRGTLGTAPSAPHFLFLMPKK